MITSLEEDVNMFNFEIGDSDFYLFAMECLYESGHVATLIPLFFNHTITETLYFDSNIDVPISKGERLTLMQSTNISHLFDLNEKLFPVSRFESICFYAIEIECAKSFRSQTAYEVHRLLHKIWNYKYSIIAFDHDDYIMLSFIDPFGNIIQSDWFSKLTQRDELIQRMCICNESLDSPREYFFDFAYSVARSYYIYDISPEYAYYELCPLDYFSSYYIPGRRFFDNDEVKETIHNILNSSEIEYGDDYIEPFRTVKKSIDFSDEIDLISFELEYDTSALNVESSEDNKPDNENIRVESDEYEFEHLDPSLFDDPTLLIKWIENQRT